jgi:hypothetical protein
MSLPVIVAIPGVHGVRPWGTYFAGGTRVWVTVCVEDTARGVCGAAAVGPAFDSGYRRHDIVSAVTVGYHHTQCRATLARCTSHLVIEALSGYKTARSARRGKLKRVYGRASHFHECGVLLNRGIFDKSNTRLASSVRYLVIEATYSL